MYQIVTPTTPYTSQEDLPKETYTYKKKPTRLKRDVHISNRYTHHSIHISGGSTERDLHIQKETYMYEKSPIKRDVHISNRYTHHSILISGGSTKRDVRIRKETNMFEKSPIKQTTGHISKETYKQDSKETYKRDMLTIETNIWYLGTSTHSRRVCGVATIIRLLRIIGLFCKRAL